MVAHLPAAEASLLKRSGPLSSGSPRIRVRRRLVRALALVFVMLGAVEVGWRLADRIGRGTPVLTLLPDHRETQFLLSPFLVFGPRIDHQIRDRKRPEQAYFDERGFRTNEPVGPKPPGEFRILAVGGSTTENYRNRMGLHWPLVLECRLRAAGRPNVRVLNASMSAYSTAHTLIRLQFDLLEYDPDLVIVFHAINDLNVTYRAKALGRPVDGHYRSKYAIDHFTNQLGADDIVLLRSWRAFRDWVRPPAPPSEPVTGYDLEPGLSYFRRNLESIETTLRARGIGGVFLTMPVQASRVEEHRVNPENAGIVHLPVADALREDLDRYNRTIIEVAEASSDVSAVDMADLFPDDPTMFLDIIHYTTEGVIRFGHILARELDGEIPATDEPYDLSAAAVRRCDW